MSTPAITERAVLVNLSISQWVARKFDKKATAAANAAFGADKDAGRYNKLLIAKDRIKQITNHVASARNLHKNFTLSWDDNGTRILPLSLYSDYKERMNEKMDEFWNLVNQFIDDYPVLVEEARLALNGMFNEADYPHVSELRSKFNYEYMFDAIPTGDFRAQIPDLEEQREEINNRVQKRVQEAMSNVYSNLQRLIGHMVERIEDYSDKQDAGQRTRLDQSIIDNIKEFCDLIPDLNVVDDEKLEHFRVETLEKLAGIDVDNLKNNSGYRESTAKKAADILKNMEGYM